MCPLFTFPDSIAFNIVEAPALVIMTPWEPLESHVGAWPLAGEHHPNQMKSPILFRWHNVAILSRSATF